MPHNVRALRPGSPHRGFTLLEVLLTLLLVSAVLAAVAMAVDFQLRVVERGRHHVEEGQLARVLLHRIADDLRGAVPDDPMGMKDLCAQVVFSNIESAEATAAAVTGGSAESGSTQDSGSSGDSGGAKSDTTDGGNDSQASQAANEESTESAGYESLEAENGTMDESSGTGESSVPRSKPGVYGGSDWLQVDVGRLPRLDQFQSLYTATDGSTPADRLSDVKTVTYYVVPPEEGTTEAPADGTEPTTGLVRRELDRAVSSWASGQGELDTTSTDVTPIAPEVTAIAFRYSDGSEWVEEWDTGEAGALPVAVEITLTIKPHSDANDQSAWGTSTSATSIDEEQETLTYKLIVQLQAAKASSSGGAGGEGGSGTSEGTSEQTGQTGQSSETTGSGSSGTASNQEGRTQ